MSNHDQDDLVGKLDHETRPIRLAAQLVIAGGTLATVFYYLVLAPDPQSLIEDFVVTLPEGLQNWLNAMLLESTADLRAYLAQALESTWVKFALFAGIVGALGIIEFFLSSWMMRWPLGARELGISVLILVSVVLAMALWHLIYSSGTGGGVPSWTLNASVLYSADEGVRVTSSVSFDESTVSWARSIIIGSASAALFILFISFQSALDRGIKISPFVLLVGLFVGFLGAAANWRNADTRLVPTPILVKVDQCERTTVSQLDARGDLVLTEIKRVSSQPDLAEPQGNPRADWSGDRLACVEYSVAQSKRFRLAFLLARHKPAPSQCEIFALDGDWSNGALAIRNAKRLKVFTGPDCEGLRAGITQNASEYFDATALQTFFHTDDGLPIVTQ